jgi:hypothetical protein
VQRVVLMVGVEFNTVLDWDRGRRIETCYALWEDDECEVK